MSQTICAGKWQYTPGSQWQLEADGGNGLDSTLPRELHRNDLVLASTYTTCGVWTVRNEPDAL